MINKVILTGRLTQDIELRQTSDGIPFTYFTVAVNRQTNRDQTDFVPCVAWRSHAEFLKNYLTKGSLIGVEGRIEVFTIQQDGHYNTRININVSQIHFLEPRRSSSSGTSLNEEAPRFNNNYNSSNSSNFDNRNFNEKLTFEKESNVASDNDGNSEVNYDEIDFDNIKF